MAWLMTAPEKSDPKDSAEPVSRLRAMRDRGEDPLLPPNPAKYLTDWLFEVGPTVPAGWGEAGIGDCQIRAWMDNMGIELLPWEVRLLKRLSALFANERAAARKRDSIAPYNGTVRDVESRRDMVVRKMRSLFGLKRKSS